MNQSVNTPLIVSELKARFDTALNEVISIQAVVDDRVQEKVEILEKMAFANAYLDNKEEVLMMLGRLQEKVQRKTKGFFEDLLTQLVHEILPEEKGNRIVFDINMKNNNPTLDVCIEKDGELEDVYEDNGGALTNIISMGLRFIVLSRSSNRRFLIFDEADAWIEPSKIPAFVSVLSQLSRKLGVQVLVISHHNSDMFSEAARIVRLEKDQFDNVISSIIHEPANDEPQGDSDKIREVLKSGFKYLRLRGFKSHTNTVIAISPNVTVITGGNNVGKSHIARAFRAMRECQTIMRNINRKSDYCHVEFGLEDGGALVWEYHRSASSTGNKKKTVYYATNSQGVKIDELKQNDKVEVPEWLENYLHMPLLDGHDVHLVDQKMPVFMIGPDLTPQRRATLLSMGSENNYVQQMIKKHNDTVKMHNSDLKNLKSRLKYIEKDVKVIRQAGMASDILDKLKPVIMTLTESEASLKKIKKRAERLQELKEEIRQRNEIIDVLDQIPEVPQLIDVRDLGRRIGRMTYLQSEIDALEPIKTIEMVPEVPALIDITRIKERSSRMVKLTTIINKLKQLPDMPEIISEDQLTKTQAIAQRTDRMERLEVQINLLNRLPKENIEIHDLHDIAKVRKISVRILNLQDKVKNSHNKVSELNKELKQVEEDMDALIEQVGESCPFCKQSIKHVH